MKKKLIASLLCLAMILAIVTPAVFASEDNGAVGASTGASNEDTPVVKTTESPVEEPTAEPTTEPEGENEEPEGGATDNDGGATVADGTAATEPPAQEGDVADPENNPEEDAETPVEGETEEPEVECTCGTEDDTHAEDCPLYEINVEAVYNSLMACQTCDEMDSIVSGLTENDATLFTEEQVDAILTHYHELYVEENTIVVLPDAINYTAVAPFVNWDNDVPTTLALFDDEYPVSSQSDRVDSSAVESKKTAVKNSDGTYTITIESFVTGNVTAGEVKPCDIILVLDMSTSMEKTFGSGGTTYDEVYTLDKTKSYYIETTNYDYTRYTQVSWCSTCSAWTNGCNNFGGHNPGTEYTPKTSETDTTRDQFYTRTVTSSTTRLEALKTAATNFVETVASKEEDNKIAVVGFHDSGKYLTGSNANSALLDAKTQKNTIKSAISGISNNSLKAATDHNDGLKLAEDIFAANNGTSGTRNRVVVMITDGAPEPLNKSNWSETTVKEAITSSYNLKDTYWATVYTISVMPGSNASNPTSDMDKYMSYLSSNYPNAKYTGTSTNSTNSSTIINRITPGEKANTGSTGYYLSANDTSALNSIFGQIAAQTGGASIALDSTTVVNDTISDYFTLPKSATANSIKVYTADATGSKDADGNYLFEDRTESGLKATIGQDGKTVSVTGFDFSSNFVAETGRAEGDVSSAGSFYGRKLIIEFTVEPEAEFWGGNNVPTNKDTSGIYKDGTVIENFDEPKVNVPISEVTLNAVDANVYYLGQTPDVDSLYTTNYSDTSDWRTEYVTVTKPSADSISNTADGSYPITITVSPKYDAAEPTSTQGEAATAKSATATAKINVFKPELTFKDGEAYYGDTEPSYEDKLTKTEWKHGDTVSTAVSMGGTAPTLDLTYTPETDKIVAGKVETDEDFAVDVTVKIGEADVTANTTFQHTDCTGKTCGTPDNGKFWIHVKTCELTITKVLSGTAYDTNDAFVFTVNGGNVSNLKVVIKGNGSVTIKGLKVGAYTVIEDSGSNSWSWRYTTSSTNDGKATLNSSASSGTVTFTNKADNTKWLGNSAYAKNEWNNTLTGIGYTAPEENE